MYVQVSLAPPDKILFQVSGIWWQTGETHITLTRNIVKQTISQMIEGPLTL